MPRDRRHAQRAARVTGSAGAALFAVGIASAALQLIFLVGPALAQQAAYASARSESAQDLARRSLEWLHRGEDETNRDAKMADYREGLDLAQRAIAADDTNADAHFACFGNKGRIMVLEGAAANPFNLWTARRELDRALELNPNHTDALAAKGGMYRQMPWVLGGSLAKAATYLGRSVDLDPDAVGARIELAEVYRDMGQPERSVPLLEKAAQVAERVGKSRQLGEARELLGELSGQR